MDLIVTREKLKDLSVTPFSFFIFYFMRFFSFFSEGKLKLDISMGSRRYVSTSIPQSLILIYYLAKKLTCGDEGNKNDRFGENDN